MQLRTPAEKRKPSDKDIEEPPAKRRHSTTKAPPPSPRPPAPRPESEAEDEGLPNKLRDGQKLPTLPELQDLNLSSTEYQSIAASRVLSTSIDRSRQKWMIDGVLDRYWAKPSKKKPVVESPNPAKETMTKLGPCSMIVEPHVFDVTLYTVKEIQSNSATPISSGHALPQPKSQPPRPNDYLLPPLQPPFPVQPPQAQPQSSSTSANLTLPPFREGFGRVTNQGPLPPVHPPNQAPKQNELAQTPRGQQGTFVPNQSGGNLQDAKDNSDPVIQMLASRAASDHDLKALMKIVASGHATQTQLRDFQDHIDELNSMLKPRGTPDRDQDVPKPPPSPPSTTPQVLTTPSPIPPSNQVFNPPRPFLPAPVQSTPTPISRPVKQEPLPQYYSHYSQPTKPKYSSVTAVVLDIGGSGDRFLFPRFSILEYVSHGHQVIASFLVIRNGSTAASGNYKANTSYYQPITIRLSASQPRLLDTLTRVVAPPEEVRNYMNSIANKMPRAEKVFLATRLPYSSDAMDIDTPGRVLSDDIVVRRQYSPPTSMVPLAA